MRVVFMGTPAFAVPVLRALASAGHEVAAVVTQPDRAAGRGRAVRIPPVKELALERGLVVEQPEKLRDPAVVERLRMLAPEVIAVAAYGKILPRALLELPPRGAINVHGSLLPRYRGAAPIQRALLAGDATTGVTIMQMNERMDEGDILLQRSMPILPDDTAATLGARMAEIGAAALIEALAALGRGTLQPTPQRDDEATLAPLVRKEEGEIDWRRTAAEIERAVRAFTPWPSAYTRVGEKLLKIHRAEARAEPCGSPPGVVIGAADDGVDVSTGGGVLRIREAQVEGRRRMTARELLTGRTLSAGERLGR